MLLGRIRDAQHELPVGEPARKIRKQQIQDVPDVLMRRGL
jgi:hypothetical protein